jgi:hypothetical protein
MEADVIDIVRRTHLVMLKHAIGELSHMHLGSGEVERGELQLVDLTVLVKSNTTHPI